MAQMATGWIDLRRSWSSPGPPTALALVEEHAVQIGFWQELLGRGRKKSVGESRQRSVSPIDWLGAALPLVMRFISSASVQSSGFVLKLFIM